MRGVGFFYVIIRESQLKNRVHLHSDTLREISGALKSFCRVDYTPASPRATKGQSVQVTVKILKQNISIQAPSRASLSAP
jgi:hypothetical protein